MSDGAQMDLLTRIEASLEFMNDGGPIRVDFVNLRQVLEGSREALLVMRQIEEALRHGFSVEPGSFLHDEVTRLCSEREGRTPACDKHRYDAASAPVLCADCPPPDYPTDETRCAPCPRRSVVERRAPRSPSPSSASCSC